MCVQFIFQLENKIINTEYMQLICLDYLIKNNTKQNQQQQHLLKKQVERYWEVFANSQLQCSYVPSVSRQKIAGPSPSADQHNWIFSLVFVFFQLF